MLYGYCTNAYAAVEGLEDGTTIGAAMQLSPSAINYFRGCRISAIAIANGSKAAGSTTDKAEINLFVRAALNEDPIQSFKGEMDLSNPYDYKEYALTTPIEITDNMEPLIFGYTTVIDSKTGSTIITDNRADQTAGPGDYFGIMDTNGNWQWEQLRSILGMPGIRLKIEGAALPANDVAIIEKHLPTYATPGGKGPAGLFLRNDAGNTVESVNITYTINGGDEQTMNLKLDKPLLYNEYTSAALEFDLDMPDIQGNDIPVSIEIKSINDGAANNADETLRTASSTCLLLESGFEKNMVAEIGTATWCGFCPRGIVGTTKMAEAHIGDSRFIPIAVHYNDALTVQSYDQFFNETYTNGSTPSSLINRNMETYGRQDPSFEFLSSAYMMETSMPAVGSIEIKSVDFNEASKRITINATTRFAIDLTGGDYGLSFVITEDGVGPYKQTNYFSPESDYADYGFVLEGWDDKPVEVEVTYNSIARNIYSFRGLKGSIPAEIKADTDYDYSASVQTNLVGNINNCNIIVMLVNRNSLRIENAVSIPYTEFSAINSIKADSSEGPAEYFDLQGRIVASPAKGKLYIERKVNTSRKIIL